MSLYREILAWEEKLHLLLEEGAELKERINELEQQNALLQRRLVSSDYPNKGGFDALRELYEEGYHICPSDFGQIRDDECIFCLNFLLHKGRNDAKR